jgi:TolB-like protein/DNA-binding winged helix-turn-helix (wHTH) protein
MPAIGEIVGDAFRLGTWLIQPTLNTISCNGTRVRVEPKQMEVLVCLAQHPAEPISKEGLLRAVWSDTFVSDDVLTRSISELRHVLEDDAREPRFIETIPKRGYRLVAPVERVDIPLSGDPGLDRSLGKVSPAKSRVALLPATGVVLSALALVLIASGAWNLLLSKNSAPRIRSVAVLPLLNLTNDPSQEYFADGMTEQVITELSRSSTLKVRSRTTVMLYKESPKSLPEIARELDVDAVIEGSVLRSGDRIRITSQLIFAKNDTHLWAETYDSDVHDVLTLQGEVAKKIVDEVRAKMTSR